MIAVNTYPVADTSGTVLARLQRVHQGYDNTGARVTDGMAESDSTADDTSQQMWLGEPGLRGRTR